MKANLLLLSSLFIVGCAKKQQEVPNVIVILADDLGFGDVSAYGAKTINTPNIDKLANEGICFNNGYATSATSTPSRYALMTGIYPWKNTEAKILPGDAPLIIGEDDYTLPKMMQQSGYKTAAIGKWHLGMGKGKVDWNKPVLPGANQIGFDYSCLIAATNDRVPTVYVENGSVVGLESNDPIFVDYEKNFDGEPTALSNPEMLKMKWSHGHNNSIVNGIPRIGFMKGGENARWTDENMADYFLGKVKDFIKKNKDNPFFLYYGLHQPHVPRAPHSRFVGTTGLGSRGDAIAEADWCVGQLINYLDSLGIIDNTLVVFSSDNGPVVNDGYLDGSVENLGTHKPAGRLRGGKYSLYDGGTHVPFFLYWKGHVIPKKSDAIISQLDLLASLATLIGRPINTDSLNIDSRDFLPALLGESSVGRDFIILEAQGKMAIRKGDWIMIPPYDGPKQNETGNELGNLGEYGLYNIKLDPDQKVNLSNKYPDILDEMKKLFFSSTKGYYKAYVEEVPLK